MKRLTLHRIASSLHRFIASIAQLCVHDYPLPPLAPLVPLIAPFHLLGTLLAVTGSVHLFLGMLVNWPLYFPHLPIWPPPSEIPTPWGFSRPKYTFIRTTLRTQPICSLTLPFLQCRHYLLLHYYSLVLLMPRRAAPSPSIASMSMRVAGSLPPPLGHQE
jgi:hypothetical protein